MYDLLFKSRAQRERDIVELGKLKQLHGNHTAAILKLRATDLKLDSRSRKHWQRLIRLV